MITKKMITKKIASTLAIGVITFGITLGAFLTGPVKAACAVSNPSLDVRYLVTNLNGAEGWTHSVSAKPGDTLQFYIELHNTVVGSTADNPRIRVTATTGDFTSGTSTAHFTADNASEASDQDQFAVNPAAHFIYIPGSTKITWDANGDGVNEFNNTVLADGITSGGISLPNNQMHGCNAYIAQMSFKMSLSGTTPTPSPSPTPSATPSPTPSVTPSPTPSASPVPSATPVASPSPTPEGGNQVSCPEGFNQQVNGSTIVCVQNVNNNTNNNSNSQSQSQDNHQEQNVNITNNVTNPSPTVLSASIPLKSPDTGVGVLGMVSMFSAAPIGLALSRFGRGRITLGKREEEEDLGSIANGLVKSRKENSDQ